jgi:hypothetical protein
VQRAGACHDPFSDGNRVLAPSGHDRVYGRVAQIVGREVRPRGCTEVGRDGGAGEAQRVFQQAALAGNPWRIGI